MAELERNEHGDSGRARAWMLRAVRARHDPVWTADGYVSDRWRPVSPVTGRLDAFQWQTPLAALPSDKGVTVEASPFEEAMLAPPRAVAGRVVAAARRRRAGAARGAGQFSGSGRRRGSRTIRRPQPAAVEAAPPPMFRPRQDFARSGASAVPAGHPHRAGAGRSRRR